MALLALPAGLGLLVGGAWLESGRPKQRLVGAISLALGFWLSLALLFCSSLWLWELNELWPVKPAALKAQALGAADLHLWRQGERPSLNWYLTRRVEPADDAEDLHPDAKGVAWLLADQRPDLPGWDCQPQPGQKKAALVLLRCQRR